MPEERFCSNCRAELPRDADSCPACGVYAGDVFDGKLPRKPSRYAFFLTLLALAVAAAGAAVWLNMPRPAPAPVKHVAPQPAKVVHGRVNEAEAIRALRRYLVATFGIPDNCVALISRGVDRDAYVVTAVNGCNHMRLGTWRVDAKNGAVTKAAP